MTPSEAIVKHLRAKHLSCGDGAVTLPRVLSNPSCRESAARTAVRTSKSARSPPLSSAQRGNGPTVWTQGPVPSRSSLGFCTSVLNGHRRQEGGHQALERFSLVEQRYTVPDLEGAQGDTRHDSRRYVGN